MAVLARAARHLLELVDMTEVDAYRQYEGHVAKCHTCQPDHGRLCKKGLKLHNQWRVTEAQQPAARQ